MFRIHFQPRGGFWCIQFLVWGLFWATVRVPKLNNAPKVSSSLVVAQFDSYESACTYVEEKGIDVAYQYKDNSSMMAAVSSQAVVVQQDFSNKSSVRRFRVQSGQ